MTNFSARTQAIFDGMTYFLALSVVPLAAIRGIETSNYARDIGQHSFMLKIPAYPFIMAMGIGFLVLSLVLFTLMVKSIVKAVQG